MSNPHSSLKPIGFANGDGGTGRGAALARHSIFLRFPTEDVPVTVEARLETNDLCIDTALAAFRKCGAGFKNSTASNDKRIKKAGKKSANIVMRPKAGAFALLRMLQAASKYGPTSGIIRYAHGGFYDEREFSVVQEKFGGRRIARIVQEMDVDAITPYANLAADVAKESGLHLILASKSTIARSEEFFRLEVERIWAARGLKPGETKNRETGAIWTGDYHFELTDVALASLPINATSGVSWGHAPVLGCFDNPNGDSGSDLMEFQVDGRIMGSQVWCENEDGSQYTYEELPGGTADGKTTGPLKGAQFLDPTSIIFAMAAAFQKVNPDQKAFFDAVRAETLKYCTTTPREDRDTEALMSYVTEQTQGLLVLPA